ncbi:MAG: helix-turn-helix transcriptional regulator [Alphaproteobacteria bacterium]|nr:helix-turn-helix transcriptional regulator [Alphaproteobacteria bacterium]
MTARDPDLDALFSALGDPTRRAILTQLAHGPASVGELASGHAMALPSFMGHLKKLEASGLVATTKEGRVRSCRLVPEALAPVRTWLDEQRELWESRLDRFDAYVLDLMKERQNATRSED